MNERVGKLHVKSRCKKGSQFRVESQQSRNESYERILSVDSGKNTQMCTRVAESLCQGCKSCAERWEEMGLGTVWNSH